VVTADDDSGDVDQIPAKGLDRAHTTVVYESQLSLSLQCLTCCSAVDLASLCSLSLCKVLLTSGGLDRTFTMHAVRVRLPELHVRVLANECNELHNVGTVDRPILVNPA
jgi:hypothetical protein